MKSIANLNPAGLNKEDPNYVSISKIEYISGYSQKQLDLLCEHDLEYDSSLSTRYKKNYRPAFCGLFEGQPVIQAQISGFNALPKLKALVGPKNPTKGNESLQGRMEKETLGSFYGVDRIDNAFFVSETVAEAILEG